MKIQVTMEFGSMTEMFSVLGQGANTGPRFTGDMKIHDVVVAQPVQGLRVVKDDAPDADEDKAPAPKRRTKRTPKKRTKAAPPADEEEESEDEEEETPRAKRSVKKGALRDLLDPADDEDGDEDEEDEEEEAPRAKKETTVEPKTLDDVRAAARAFAKQHGADVLSDVLLEKFDYIEALDDLKPKHYNEAIGVLMFYEKPKKGGKG